MHNIRKRNEGFTIIEVMIVLAIAGLIMLIVFLAVPALQRNSRNTQYKNDAASYGAAANEWSTNNNGKTPSVAADMTAIAALAKLGTLTAPTAVVTGAQTTAVPIGGLQLVTKAKCDPANIGNSVGSASRAMAIRYSIEDSSNNPVKQCFES
jgi:prepilin-type N-terminal cleavage/methylation domain-containing protein